MTEDMLLGFLLGLLGLCYLINLRLKKIIEDVTCIHDFIHYLSDTFGLGDDVVNTALDRMKDSVRDSMSSENQVPPAFEEWDES